MARLNRRDFLKALGLGGSVSALAACGLDDNRYLTPVEQFLPYVVKGEVHTPGTPTFFATTVTTGPAAFPVTARHREGRVVHIGANSRAPFAPAVPAAALLALQRQYSPDRFTAPRLREGSTWSDTDWEDGLGRLSTAVEAARDGGKKIAYLGPYRSGSIVNLLQDFTGGEAVFWEPLGPEAEAEAAEVLFGQRVLPAYQLSEARYVLSFGADFLGQWGNVHLAGQYADARDPNKGHFIARFAMVGPYLDQTGANCDDWYAVHPGAEAAVALAVARLVAVKSGYRGPLEGFLREASPSRAAEAAGLSPADLDAIASQFVSASEAGGAVALPGGTGGASKAGVDLALATYLINLVSGNGGRTFGLGPHYAGPIDGYRAVASLLADMKAGRVGVLLLDDVNPAYALPRDAEVAEALAGVDLVVSLSGYPDETNAAAHLVLPTSSTLEDWGDEEPQGGLYLLRQPAMAPLHDTRALGDILLETARTAGLTPLPSLTPSRPAEIDDEGKPTVESEDQDVEEEAEPAPGPLGFEPLTWKDYLAARWEREIQPMHAMGRQFAFAEWWRLALVDGFLRLHRDEISGRSFHLANPTAVRTNWPFSGVAAFEGDGALFLHVHPHPFRQDGRFANEPWAQETGDPMTGQTWDSWVEVAPTTAERLGLEDGDRVEVRTPHGALSLGVQVYPGVRGDTVAIAFGQGHTALGRYAGFGVNVVDLLAVASAGAPAFAWQQVRATLRKGVGQAALAPTVGKTRLEGRQLAVQVSAAALAEQGDVPTEHPGSLTGIHHLERDERLVRAGVADFYEAPDHPVHRWALTVDTNACNGCGICVIACYAENNIPVVGKELVRRGKEMNWLRINRYWGDSGGQPSAQFLPVMCQQCTRAPCESVCPVLATYHNHEGLNAMIYNRCVGTRYCANNCPYQARRFNFHSYAWPEPFNLQLNPDVAVRTMGIMEKCTFCVQRIREVKGALKDRGHTGAVPDAYLRQLPACAEVCPSQALTFGNLEDERSAPAMTRRSGRSYLMLEELRVEPGVNYLGRASFHLDAPHEVQHLDLAPGDSDTPNHPAPDGAGSH